MHFNSQKKLTTILLLSAFLLAQSAYAEYEPKFETAMCPKPSDAAVQKALAKAHCGYLTVPENRSKNSERTIRLAVVILPALSKQRASDPIVHLAGGPGKSAILEAPLIIQSGLNRTHDVILMSQRGTLFSQPALTCPEIDKFNALSVGLSYDSDATKKLHLAATSACHNRLMAKGIDLSAYNTTESAADFSDLRIALKIPNWNVYAYAYGTDLALNLARLYPDGIRSIVLDSVVPPNLASLGWKWKSAKEGINNLFTACEKDRNCRETYPDLALTFKGQVSDLEANPVVTSIKSADGKRSQKVVIDGGALVNWLVTAELPPSIIPLALKELSAGHPKKIAADRSLLADPNHIGEIGHGLTFGVLCSEWVPYENPAQLAKQGHKAFPSFPVAVQSQAPQFPYLAEDCDIWKVPKATADVRSVVSSEIPTLILTGTFDSRTGASYGSVVAKSLKHTTIIDVPGSGHWVTLKSACAQSIITSFLEDPISPDIRCVNMLKPPGFEAS